MKQRLVATLLTLSLLVSMTGASAASWNCQTGTCVQTNKPCGELVDCTDGSCGQAECSNCRQNGWFAKLIGILAAIGITGLILNETAGQ